MENEKKFFLPWETFGIFFFPLVVIHAPEKSQSCIYFGPPNPSAAGSAITPGPSRAQVGFRLVLCWKDSPAFCTDSVGDFITALRAPSMWFKSPQKVCDWKYPSAWDLCTYSSDTLPLTPQLRGELDRKSQNQANMTSGEEPSGKFVKHFPCVC